MQQQQNPKMWGSGLNAKNAFYKINEIVLFRKCQNFSRGEMTGQIPIVCNGLCLARFHTCTDSCPNPF